MKLSRGTKREDGMFFWCYQGNKTEYWVTQEHFNKMKSSVRARDAKEERIIKKRERSKRFYHANKQKESIRKSEFYLRNKSKIIEKCKKYDKENREKVNVRKRVYQYNRRKINPHYALSCRLRGRFNSALRRRGYTKKSMVHKMVGCDWLTLKNHIESKFIDGMGWDIFYKIHIDHIVPLASAKNELELTELFHYKNLQPLWAIDNLKKGSKR